MSQSVSVDRQVTTPAQAPAPQQDNLPGDGGDYLGRAPTPDIIADGDRDYAAAVAAAEAEEAGRVAPAATPNPPPTTTAPQQTPTAPAPSSRPAPVPYERFQQAVTKGRQAAEQAIYWKGKSEALEAMLKGNVPGAAQQPTAQPAPAPAADIPGLIALQEARLLEAAKKFDDGELTTEQWTAIQIEVGRETAKLRNAELRAQQPPPVQQTGVADELVMQRHLAELNKTYPWSAAGILSHNELMTLADMARADAERKGQPFGTTAGDTMRLREEVAKLTAYWGPTWHPEMVGQPNPNAAIQTESRPTQVPAQAPQAPRGTDKIALAASHPPNVASTGRAAPANGGDFSEEQLARMTQEDWDALPAATRQRILSG